VPDLLLLCPGAAAEPASAAGPQASRGGLFDVPSLADELAGGSFARAFRTGALQARSDDETLVPREMPHERWLRARLGIADGDAIEACSAAAFGVSFPRWRATPAHLRLAHDHLILDEPGDLHLQPEEAEALAQAARPILADDGWSLTLAAPLRWFLASDSARSLSARSWTMASGRNVDAWLPEGDDARRWRRVLTEVQMTWFDHPVNQAREGAGRSPVNMLWLDGAATGHSAPARPRARGDASSDPTTVYSRDDAIVGAALVAGLRIERRDATELDEAELEAAALAAPAGAGTLLLDVDAWRQPRRRGDVGAWVDAWHAFEAWFAAAVAPALSRRAIGRIDAVFTGERRVVEISSRGTPRWRFWQRFDALSQVLRP
jgi:hypothetical protein